MRRFHAALCLTAAALSTNAFWVAASEPAKPAIIWQSDLNDAHRISLEQKKPMLLVFGAPWCHYCKKLEQSTLTNADLVRYVNANFVAVHIDVDEQKRVAEILEVESLPCTIILSPEADLLGRFEGFRQPAAVYTELAKARRQMAPAVQTASKTAREEPARR